MQQSTNIWAAKPVLVQEQLMCLIIPNTSMTLATWEIPSEIAYNQYEIKIKFGIVRREQGEGLPDHTFLKTMSPLNNVPATYSIIRYQHWLSLNFSNHTSKTAKTTRHICSQTEQPSAYSQETVNSTLYNSSFSKQVSHLNSSS